MADEEKGSRELTPQDVRDRVDDIRAMAGDDEIAHGAEDDLWELVLVAVSEGSWQSRHLATEALKTRDIKFARWYA